MIACSVSVFTVIEAHRLTSARWLPSPHCEPRVVGRVPELIVVHCVSLPEGEFGTAHPRSLFLGALDCSAHDSFADLEGLKVSPHLMIDRTGEVDQFVAFDHVAWHAGSSSWRARAGCNAYSIGIELEGCVNSAYEPCQYERLAEIVLNLLDAYSTLSVEALVGHNEVAPGRKFDPGPHFDWSRLYRQVYSGLSARD